MLFCDEARNPCIRETNTYADQTGDCVKKRWVKWDNIDEKDLLQFLAIRMLMGITKKPEMKKYWSRDPLYNFPIVSKIMSQNRFFEIHKNLHFATTKST